MSIRRHSIFERGREPYLVDCDALGGVLSEPGQRTLDDGPKGVVAFPHTRRFKLSHVVPLSKVEHPPFAVCVAKPMDGRCVFTLWSALPGIVRREENVRPRSVIDDGVIQLVGHDVVCQPMRDWILGIAARDHVRNVVLVRAVTAEFGVKKAHMKLDRTWIGRVLHLVIPTCRRRVQRKKATTSFDKPKEGVPLFVGECASVWRLVRVGVDEDHIKVLEQFGVKSTLTGSRFVLLARQPC
mmetsp:Transcript_15766/g.40790  ORF Transcript_15766/g.40790 Transcript_15766/m.40790 type:complete len:240 (-) Transcript_15766:613-1332(-)